MTKQSPGPLIRVSITAMGFILALFAGQSFLPSLGYVAALALCYAIIPLALFYVINRSFVFGHVGEPRRLNHGNYLITPEAFLVIVLGPSLLLFFKLIADVGSVDAAWFSRLSVALLGAILIALLVSPAVRPGERNAIAAYLSIPLSLASLIVVLGGHSWFGYLDTLLSTEIFEIVSLGRFGMLLAALAIVSIALIIELVRAIVECRADFLAPWVAWRTWYDKLNLGDPADSRPFEQLLNAIAVAISIVGRFFILLTSLIIEFAIVLAKSGVKSLLELFDLRRMGISITMGALILFGLFIEQSSVEFLMLIGRSGGVGGHPHALLVVSILIILWMGVFTIAFARFCYQRSDGIVFGHALVAILVVFGVWLFSLALHVLQLFGLRGVAGYAFDLNSIFFFEITLIIAQYVAGRLFFDAPSPARGKKLATFLMAYAVAGALVIVALTVVIGVPAAALQDEDSPSTLSILGPPSVAVAAPPEASPVIEPAQIPAPKQTQSEVPIRLPPIDPTAWIGGSWGIDGSCATTVAVRSSNGALEVTFRGQGEPQPIQRSEPNLVETAQWQFSRLNGVIRARYNGADLGALTPCNIE